jgi:proteasome assembly chaperone (PAC2) family protein
MKKIFLSCLAALFCISIIAQNSVNLKMNLEKNKVYRFRSSSEQTITQTINGNQQNVDSKTSSTVSIKMVDATADFIVAEVRFDTIIYNTNSMGKTSIISSVNEGDIKSSETADVMSCIMNRLCKNALYIKMDFAGKILEIVNSKMLSDVIMKDTSAITLTGMMGTGVKTQIINTVSDKTLKTMVEAFTNYLPGKQVSTGDNWNVTVQVNSGGMILDIITGYHLDGIKGNNANVTAESNIKASENADPMIAGGAKITYDDLKGLSKSNMVIDIHTGLLIEDKAKTHIAGNLGISAPGMTMTMPMDINGESKVIALQ